MKQPLKLVALTIGQAPRPDIWNEIEAHLSFPHTTKQHGLLDIPGLLNKLKVPQPFPGTLTTQTRNGQKVWLSADKVHYQLSVLINRYNQTYQPEAIIVLCTGILAANIIPAQNVFLPGKMIREQVTRPLPQPVGVVLPSRKQWPYLDPQLARYQVVLTEMEPPGDIVHWYKAADFLKQKQVRSILFHCLGYPLENLGLFTEIFDMDIVHPKQLLIDQLNKKFGKKDSQE